MADDLVVRKNGRGSGEPGIFFPLLGFLGPFLKKIPVVGIGHELKNRGFSKSSKSERLSSLCIIIFAYLIHVRRQRTKYRLMIDGRVIHLN